MSSAEKEAIKSAGRAPHSKIDPEELEAKAKDGIELGALTSQGSATPSASGHYAEDSMVSESEFGGVGAVREEDREDVPRWVVVCCQYSWRSPVLPMIWLAAMFTLFWTCFGFVGKLESQYKDVAPVGCCGMIVDDTTAPASVNEIEGISHMCRLSNLTSNGAFNVSVVEVSRNGETATQLHCVSSVKTPSTKCERGVDNVTISECLRLTALSANDVCEDHAIEKAFNQMIRNRIEEGFSLTKAYCIIILSFILLLFLASVYLWRQVPPTLKGGHTVFYLSSTFLYIMPSLALITLVFVMYDKPCPNSWLWPYSDTGLISLEPSNDAQEYVAVNCANENFPIIINGDATVKNKDELNNSCDAIQSVLTSVMYMVLWPIINCILGIWITGGERCMSAT